MSDNDIGVEPLRTETADPGPLSEADRAARIEQLLLSGLDHYFGGNYEQAINVWTRVAFLERGHGRARAYMRKFALCRLCFRELALTGDVAGVTKSSW